MSTTVDPLFGLIQVSKSVKIKRFDGRIHLAKIIQLSVESKSVGVEWNEHGEVKGKEIPLDLIFELNNEFRPNSSFKQPASIVNQQVRPIAAVNVPSSGLSSNRLTLDIVTLEREYNSRLPPPLQSSLQIPPPSNNKPERRLSRLTTMVIIFDKSFSYIPSTSEPPPSIGLLGPFGQMILDYRSTLTYTPLIIANLHQHQNDLRICAVVRKRPLNKREIAKKDNDVITIPNKDHCLVHVPNLKVDLTKYLENQTFK